MMQTNKEALREFLRGVTLTIAMTVGIGLVIVSFSKVEKEPEDRFKVVDTYSNCAIVRYRPENRAEDVFFLDCGNFHLSERE